MDDLATRLIRVIMEVLESIAKLDNCFPDCILGYQFVPS
eukprot:XP_001708999.1 Hypothetical protein GL50803_21782 [Giardia lamblia ATCC 50803]